MKVINFFGGPGIGKSTQAIGLMYEMKKLGLNVEQVAEYAKDMVYENRGNILADQLYILAKQNRRISRLLGHGVDYAISDSPLPTGLLYVEPGYFSTYEAMTLEVFESYDNLNILLQRNPSLTYNPVGRVQKDVETAREIDEKLLNLLESKNIPYKAIMVDDNTITEVLGELGLVGRQNV